MFTWLPRNASVLLLTDVRNLADANFDAKHKPEAGAQAVLRGWWPGLEVWGKGGWEGVARCALFEFGQKVDKAARAQANKDLTELFSRHKFTHIIVLQSRSKSARKVYNEDYAEASHSGSVCWSFLRPPAALAEMSGTFWQTEHGTVLALQNPQNVDYVYGAMTCRWLKAIKSNMSIFLPSVDTTYTMPGLHMYAGLKKLLAAADRGVPIAIDIESFSTEDLITVIGLSDGHTTCSVPWEPFTPYGQAYTEPGYHLKAEGQMVRRILATARVVVHHNGIRSDLPYLARKGVPVLGRSFDTYLAHGVLLNQFRHGLQQCVSYEFVVPPWKTFHTASAEAHGLDRDDANAWIQDPKELRTYNASDTFYTWWLGQQLAKYGGVSL